MAVDIRGPRSFVDLICSRCERRHRVEDLVWRCGCGGVLDTDWSGGVLDPDQLAGRDHTLWRYAEALPVRVDETITMGEGCTPLIRSSSDPSIQFKLDYLLPTLSFKDRGAVVVATLARALDIATAVIDTSGNAGTAGAAYLARAGIECIIFAPRSISPGKLAQMRAHGATVHLIDGDRSAVATAARAVAEAGVFYASHVYQPYFIEGVKTLGYEICEQRGWIAPAVVLVPIGNGTMALGLHRAFEELYRMGIIDTRPHLVGVQTNTFAPLARLFDDNDTAGGLDNADRVSATVAEGIAIADPPRCDQILDAITASGGCVITVDDDAIIAAHQDLARQGWFVEPTAAVCWAAVRDLQRRPPDAGTARHRAAELLQRGDIVVPLCGAGAKVPLPATH